MGAAIPAGGAHGGVHALGQRPVPHGRGTTRYALALGAARSPHPDRHQVRLRTGPLRRLHRPSRRRARAVLRHAGGRRRHEAHHHHRGPGPPWRPSPAEGLDRDGRRPVRLLPDGADHDRRGPAGQAPQTHGPRHRPGHGRERVPLRHLPADPRGHPPGRGPAEGGGPMSTTRRDFLKTTGALTLAFALPVRVRGAAAQAPVASFQPSGMLRIDPDGSITIWATRTEIGQGVRTSMAMAIAEELEADWSRVKVLQASTAPRFGDLGITGGSQTTLSTTMALRKVGAQAREMLLQAAADTWGVAKSECLARSGRIQHPPTKRSLAYGDLVARAAKLTPPAEPPLKAPKDFRILGKTTLRLDGPDIVTGRAQFATDIHLPGMLVASIERCPVFGGKVKSFDAAAALTVPGVMKVLQVSSGVAVFGEDTWAAFAG